MRTWDRMWSVMLTKVELEGLSAHALHGTHARYNGHLLAGEEPCDRCRDGEARYRAKLKEKRLAAQAEAEQPRQSFTRTTVSQIEDEEDEEDEEEEEEEEEEDEEELESDDAPSWRAAPAFDPAPSLASTFEVLAAISGRGQVLAPSPNGRRSPQITMPSTNGSGTDPRTRLQAISTELNTRKPRGPQAVKLLVEAAPYLTGGVNALAQYGEARGCDPGDIAAAERAVIGKGRR